MNEKNIYFSSTFGFVKVEDNNALVHFPVNCMTENKWEYDVHENKYLVRDILIDACELRNSNDRTYVNVKVKKGESSEKIIISTNSECFKKVYKDSILILVDIKKIADRILFDSINVEIRHLDNISSTNMVKSDFIFNDKNFSLNDQLWILIGSGISSYSENIQPNLKTQLIFYKEGISFSKVVLNIYPCYLNSFFKNIFLKLREEKKDIDAFNIE